MRNRLILTLISMTGLLFACSLPGFDQATAPAPTLIIVPAGTVVVPGLTPGAEEETTTPIGTAVATAVAPPPVLLVTATPSVPTVTPNAVNVNCRAGPDTAYNSVSVLPFGASATVAGRTADSSWWYVQDPNNAAGFCWVAADVVTISGPTAAIPIQALPPAIVNQVTVAVAGPSNVVCGGPNPVSFSGSISTNGAAAVQYQWEITGAQTNTTGPQTLTFTGAGTQDVAGPGMYSVDCGNYTVTLHVTSPNDISASKAFTVVAP